MSVFTKALLGQDGKGWVTCASVGSTLSMKWLAPPHPKIVFLILDTLRRRVIACHVKSGSGIGQSKSNNVSLRGRALAFHELFHEWGHVSGFVT